MTKTTITNLNDLLNAMRTPATSAEIDDDDYIGESWRAAGLPVRHGDREWIDLPTFGGPEPRDTSCVWSWDETRLIVGTCSDDVRIVLRKE